MSFTKLSNGRLTNLDDVPLDDHDAVNANYVDGLSQKSSVKAATTVDISLTGVTTIDDITINENDRVLVKDQTDKTENGIYYRDASNNLIRSNGAEITDVAAGASSFVTDGTENDNTYWQCTDTYGTLFGSEITFEQVFGPVSSIELVDPAGINTVTLQAPTLTNDVLLTLPDNVGEIGYLMTTDGSGGLSWLQPSGSTSTALILEDPGAAVTTVTIHAKVGTAAYVLNLPGTVGVAGQVLSTGTTAGTMEWVDKISPGGPINGNSFILEDPGAAVTKVTLNAKIGTAAYTLILPGTVGGPNQVLSTGTTPGTAAWVDNHLPPGGALTQLQYHKTGGVFGGSPNLTWDEATLRIAGTVDTNTLKLEDTGAAITKISLNAKSGTTAYALIFPGTVGTTGQVLSTGTTPGTMEWVNRTAPGDTVETSSIILEDPGAAITKVTLNAKVGTAAYTLTLPGAVGGVSQVLSTGTTPGTMEWVDNYKPPGGALTQLQYFKTGNEFGGSPNLTWDETTLRVAGTVDTKSLKLEDPGAAITKVTLNAKVGTAAYALILPGSIGGAGQVLSTGTTVGTMEWVDNHRPPGGALTQLQFHTTGALFGGSPNLTWTTTTSILRIAGTVDTNTLKLEDTGAAITKISLNAKSGTTAYALIFPGTVGTTGQVLSTGTTPGTMEWVNRTAPGDTVETSSIIFEDPGAAITKVTLNAKVGTAAYTLTLPGAVGGAGQVLSTGTTPGTMAWVDNYKPPGGALTQLQYFKTGNEFGGSPNLTWDETTLRVTGTVDTKSLKLEDPGAAITKVTLNAKVGTAAYALILPGSIGGAGQVLSTGTTVGTMEWVDNHRPPGGALTQLQFHTTGALFGGSPNLTWTTASSILRIAGTVDTNTLKLEDTGAAITKISLNAKSGTTAYALIFPGTVGTTGQVLSTGTTPGTMEWVNRTAPGDTVETSSIILEDPGAAVTKVTLNAKVGTAAYTLTLPGAVGGVGQVLSTGTTVGTMEWVDNYKPPGGALTQLQYHKTGGVFGGSSNLTWDETTLRVAGTVDTKTLKLEDTGAAVTKVTINAKAGTAAYALILPGTVGGPGQVLSTGTTPGTMEWVNKISPGGALEGTSLILEDPGAAITKVTINAKVGTTAYTLNLPGTAGVAGQVLSTGTTAGTMAWVDNHRPPGGALTQLQFHTTGALFDGSPNLTWTTTTSILRITGTVDTNTLKLEDTGAAITKISLNAKAGTTAYALIFPGTVGTAGQVLSTGATPGTMEWVNRTVPGSTIEGTSLVLEDPGAAITKVTLTAKVGTAAYTLILPGAVGGIGQVLSTGTTPGTMAWVDNHLPPGGALTQLQYHKTGGVFGGSSNLTWDETTLRVTGTVDTKSLKLEDTGAAITKVTLNAKAGTTAYTLVLPGTIGLAGQVLSTGTTVGTMEWVNRVVPGSTIEGTSLVLEDPGAAITKVTLTAKVGTAAYTLILPGAVGGANQVLSTGTTPGTMAWVDNHLPPGGAISQLQYHKTGAIFGGSSNLTWDETTLRVTGTVDTKTLKLEDTGAAVTKISLNAKAGTTAYALIFPGTVGTTGQVLSTGTVAGTMEWVNKVSPGGALEGTSLVLEDPGAAITKVTLNAKAGTTAYTLNLPGTIGLANQVLSTGSTVGTMEWVNRTVPGAAVDTTSIIFEDPGAAITKVTLTAKVGTAAYTLILPGAVGGANQVLSTGTTPGTMAWVDNHRPPGGALTQLQFHTTGALFGGSPNLTWTAASSTLRVAGPIDANSLKLEDTGAAITKVTISAKAGTTAYALVLPGTVGTIGQVLSTGSTAGTMEWVNRTIPGGPVEASSIILEDPGAAVTKVTLTAKVGTAAYALILPGTVGAVGQVLSTGTTAGTMEWVNKVSPGGAIDCTSVIFEDPGAAITKVTLGAKVGTAAYALILPGTVGAVGQVLSTGTTAGTMEWVTKISAGGPVDCTSVIFEDPGAAITKVTMKAKVGTAAYAVILPGTVGTAGQVLSTGTTPGTAEWVTRSPLDRSTLQSCFDNPTSNGSVVNYSIWGIGGGGAMDYTMLGYSGTIVKLTCSYSSTTSIGIDAGESLSFSIGYVNLIQTVFAPFTGGLDVIVWNTAVNATYPSTISAPLNIPFTALNRIGLRSVEAGTVTPTKNLAINCVLTVQLNEV